MFSRIKYYKKIKIFESLLDATANLRDNYATKYTIDNLTICILLYNNELFAFENKCPHNAASLVGTKTDHSRIIICPMHRYGFSLTDGSAIENPCSPLKIYKVSVEEEGVFVMIEKSKLKWF